jgi:hypothetical protein
MGQERPEPDFTFNDPNTICTDDIDTADYEAEEVIKPE